eukprot:s1838_g25.t1
MQMSEQADPLELSAHGHQCKTLALDPIYYDIRSCKWVEFARLCLGAVRTLSAHSREAQVLQPMQMGQVRDAVIILRLPLLSFS